MLVSLVTDPSLKQNSVTGIKLGTLTHEPGILSMNQCVELLCVRSALMNHAAGVFRAPVGM